MSPVINQKIKVTPPSESETTSLKMTLTDGFGKMNKWKREAVIRFRKYNKDTDSTNYYHSKLNFKNFINHKKNLKLLFIDN